MKSLKNHILFIRKYISFSFSPSIFNEQTLNTAKTKILFNDHLNKFFNNVKNLTRKSTLIV